MALLKRLKEIDPPVPGFWLGIFMWVSLAVLLAIAYYDFNNRDWPVLQIVGGTTNWVAATGAWLALAGWIIGVKTSLRNSVKQHTITTLLQMRMSETYMERAEPVNKKYLSSDGIYPVTPREIWENRPDSYLAEMTYVLNYLEFLSSAVRHRDLDEKLLNDSLRGMLCNTYEIAHVLISYKRLNGDFFGMGKRNPKLYEHLEWLYNRWFDPKLQKEWLTR